MIPKCRVKISKYFYGKINKRLPKMLLNFLKYRIKCQEQDIFKIRDKTGINHGKRFVVNVR